VVEAPLAYAVQWLAAEPKTSSPGPFLTGSRHPPVLGQETKSKAAFT
jgi:hypothetical protein